MSQPGKKGRAPTREVSMDYVVEARRFIQRAVDADHPEVIKQHLKIADWYLYQEIEERDSVSDQTESSGGIVPEAGQRTNHHIE
jgi:hypothetical protein